VDKRLRARAVGEGWGVTQAASRAATVRELAATQAGIVRADQLLVFGVSHATIRSNLAAGRWRRLSRGVIALHNGPLTSEQVTWFAVLDGGDDCVLAGLTALNGYGLQGFPVPRLQLAVPISGRPGRHELYVRRRSRRLDAAAIHPARRPRAMRREVALVDALEQLTLPLRGCALLAAVVQQRLLPASSVAGLLMAERTLARRALYLAVTRDIEGGSHSLLEIDFLKLARRAGVSPPVRQAVRTDHSGRRRYLDADFDTFAVEVDGAVHLRPATWWDDMFRQNSIVLTGKPVLRFASVAVRLHPDAVIAQLREAWARWR
jgi:hypothetical protein